MFILGVHQGEVPSRLPVLQRVRAGMTVMCGGVKILCHRREILQHAEAVELVTLPMCPPTALICWRLQRTIAGCRASMAA